MADELTINYSFVMPELAFPGWGTKLNSTIAEIDNEIRQREVEIDGHALTLTAHAGAISQLDTDLSSFIQQKAALNGLASLDAAGKVSQKANDSDHADNADNANNANNVPASGVSVADANDYFSSADLEGVLQEIAETTVVGTHLFVDVPQNGGLDSVTIAHGLGTDDIDFGISVCHEEYVTESREWDSFASSICALMVSASGFGVYQGNPQLTFPVVATKPSSGNVIINVRNNFGSTGNIRVNFWVKRRS